MERVTYAARVRRGARGAGEPARRAPARASRRTTSPSRVARATRDAPCRTSSSSRATTTVERIRWVKDDEELELLRSRPGGDRPGLRRRARHARRRRHRAADRPPSRGPAAPRRGRRPVLRVDRGVRRERGRASSRAQPPHPRGGRRDQDGLRRAVRRLPRRHDAHRRVRRAGFGAAEDPRRRAAGTAGRHRRRARGRDRAPRSTRPLAA